MKNSPTQTIRLDIFDGLRGHLMVGMLIAHLSFQENLEWLKYFHHNILIRIYDAEFFVLIAGLLIGYLWTNYYKSSKSRYIFVVSRIVTVYKYYIISAIPFFYFSIYNDSSVIKSIIWVLTMQKGGWYSDILPIYFICFIIVLPFTIFKLLNKKYLMLSASATLYTISQFTNLDGFLGFSSNFVVFDIAAWQFLFVSAILIGQKGLKLYDFIVKLDAHKILMALLVITAISLFLRQNSFYPNPLMITESLTGNSPRMGLHPLYLIRILLISFCIYIFMVRTDQWILPIHKIIHWYLSLKFIRSIGKYSIQMFVFHVYIMALYELLHKDTSFIEKSIFAIFFISLFIAAPNIWVSFKKHRQN